jgi:hypothetical protein
MFVPRATCAIVHVTEAEHAQPAVRRRRTADTRNEWLARYLEGWAEVSPGKIRAATAPEYCLNDPFIGSFSRWSIGGYLKRLHWKFVCADYFTSMHDLAIVMHGPMPESLQQAPLKYFREAPKLGLTGIACITVGDSGVTGETVAYDLSLASEILRRPV